MTLDEARGRVGTGVIYTDGRGYKQDGVITSVNDAYVFVRYTGDQTSKATRATDLEPLVRS